LKVIDMVQSIRAKMPRIGTKKLYYLLGDQLKELGVGRDRLFHTLNANHLCIYSMRPHYSCFMLTPDQMHKQKDIKIRTYKKENRCKNNFATAS